MTQEKLSLIIADDHKMFIDGLCLLLQSEPGIEILSIASNGRELISLLQEHVPDVILLDINMPGFNGFEALSRIKSIYPKIKVIMLSTYNEEHLIEKAKAGGANGYMVKNADKNELINVIMLVGQGQSCFPYKQPAASPVFDEQDPFLKQFQLTKRELELLQLIKQNITNQQMAEQLNLSVYTVETHRKNIMQKLNLKNPVELSRFILQYNL
jgi:two-component system nitrate/nitrite response regulator NarL